MGGLGGPEKQEWASSQSSRWKNNKLHNGKGCKCCTLPTRPDSDSTGRFRSVDQVFKLACARAAKTTCPLELSFAYTLGPVFDCDRVLKPFSNPPQPARTNTNVAVVFGHRLVQACVFVCPAWSACGRSSRLLGLNHRPGQRLQTSLWLEWPLEHLLKPAPEQPSLAHTDKLETGAASCQTEPKSLTNGVKGIGPAKRFSCDRVSRSGK